ncbi:hypothetical protein CBM2634_A10125 [Cupriavidus taiwanensis]|uniref:Uncharacterized protein n=1 Tax=Cupriavidus taiwanensis TaxID=164546 RepID=A0A375IV40_9BURK|nr:hypothetical protein CBM2634_A10125 [Cupriavidus taiwanensis]
MISVMAKPPIYDDALLAVCCPREGQSDTKYGLCWRAQRGRIEGVKQEQSLLGRALLTHRLCVEARGCPVVFRSAV